MRRPKLNCRGEMERMRLHKFVALILISLGCGYASATNLILQLAPGIQAADVAASYGINLLDTTANAPFAFYDVSDDQADAIEQRMGTDPRVVWYDLDEDVSSPELDPESKGTVIPAVADHGALYKQNADLLKQIHWIGPIRGTMTLGQVRVAVLDTGMSPFAKGIWNRTIASANFIEPGRPAYDLPAGLTTDPHANDGLGHGSMVTGLIDLVAPNAAFVIVRVADTAGNATAWTIIKGLAFAVNNHAQLCNISLGAFVESRCLDRVTQWATERGMLIVAPSGNLGIAQAMEPASLGSVLCVTGVLPDDEKAPFSDWDEAAVAAAPATGVKSIYWNGKIAIWSGTSFAAPLVTGGLALALGNGMALDTAGARILLLNSGDSIDKLNPLYHEQMGSRLNCHNLMAGIMNPPSNQLLKPRP